MEDRKKAKAAVRKVLMPSRGRTALQSRPVLKAHVLELVVPGSFVCVSGINLARKPAKHTDCFAADFHIDADRLELSEPSRWIRVPLGQFSFRAISTTQTTDAY